MTEPTAREINELHQELRMAAAVWFNNELMLKLERLIQITHQQQLALNVAKIEIRKAKYER